MLLQDCSEHVHFLTGTAIPVVRFTLYAGFTTEESWLLTAEPHAQTTERTSALFHGL